jgi:hypothetical protein
MGTMKTRDKVLVTLLLGLAVAFLIVPDDIFSRVLQAIIPEPRCPLVNTIFSVSNIYPAYAQCLKFAIFNLILGIRGCRRLYLWQQPSRQNWNKTQL